MTSENRTKAMTRCVVCAILALLACGGPAAWLAWGSNSPLSSFHNTDFVYGFALGVGVAGSLSWGVLFVFASARHFQRWRHLWPAP